MENRKILLQGKDFALNSRLGICLFKRNIFAVNSCMHREVRHFCLFFLNIETKKRSHLACFKSDISNTRKSSLSLFLNPLEFFENSNL